MSEQLWTAVQAARWLGYQGPNAAAVARAALRRWGVQPIHPPQPGTPNQYRAADVRAAIAHTPGQGHRTDLHPLP